MFDTFCFPCKKIFLKLFKRFKLFVAKKLTKEKYSISNPTFMVYIHVNKKYLDFLNIDLFHLHV